MMRVVFPLSVKQNKTEYNKFLFLLAGSSLVPLCLVALVNFIIDPYRYFYTPTLEKISKIKPEQKKYLMLSKAAEAYHIQATTVLLGSSRVMSGLDIKHPAWENLQSVYNLGLPGVNMYQSKHYFNHALVHQPQIEQVIIGIDFFMFNQYLDNLESFDKTRLGKNKARKDIINSLFSLDTLEDSAITLAANLKGHDKYISSEATTSRFQRWLTNFLSFEGFYGKYNLSSARLKNLQTIIDLCQQHNIDVKVFISPTHATQYEAIEVAGLWSTFEEWKREVTKITPVWDFSGYNSVTTEPISDRMNNYIDSSHYSSKTGALVINRILSFQLKTVPNDFGVYLTPDNIESHLDKIRADKQIWQQNNPQEVQLVEQIKQTLTK